MLTPRLRAMLQTNTLPHAILLEGASQATRRDMALALAQALLCKQAPVDDETSMFGGVSLFGGEASSSEPAERPCQNCPHCLKVQANIHPDMRLIEGGSSARSFHIDTIRALRNDAVVLPNEADHKVYVLHNAQSMTAEAQNALLKLLEEPPDYVCMILTAPARNMLLQTVISRVAAFSLGQAEEEALDPEREALLQQHAQNLVQALLHAKTPYALLEATAPLEGNRDLVRELLPCLRRTLHAALVKDIALAPRALGLIDSLRELELALERNANLNLLITQLAGLGI